MDASEPTPRTEPSRDDGRATRAALLDAAASMFLDRGLGGVSLTEVARAAGAHPSQVTYYFGGKEGLFVEAACRELLRVAARVESAGMRATDPESFVRGIVHAALSEPSLMMFIEAMLLARRRTDLAPEITATFQRLHAEGERAVTETLVRRGWSIRTSPATEARAFWATVVGVALERAVTGGGLTDETAEAAVLLVLNLYPDANP